MSEKIKVMWATPERDILGNGLGYATHNKFMKKYCEEYFDYCEDADIAITITPANFFIPIPGKFNVLFTMWETPDVPNEYIVGLDRADLIVVPCRFCRDLFREVTDTPIVVCPEGVESDKYPYFERSMPTENNKFRFLWVGAPNPRKGYPTILECIKVLEKFPRVEIYIKTTFQRSSREELLKKFWNKRKELRSNEKGKQEFSEMFKRMQDEKFQLKEQLVVSGLHNNVIFDSRRLSFDELINLYNSAHCFVLPHCGEGWGLTLCEAMATGAPCISGAYTGCADFFDEEVGFTVGYQMREHNIANYGNMKSKMFIPDTNSVFNQMINVIQNYHIALKKGKKASERIHKKFTWERAAIRLKDIIKEVKESQLCAV